MNGLYSLLLIFCLTLVAATSASVDTRSATFEYVVTGNYEKIPAATIISNNYYIMSGGSLKTLSTNSTATLGAERWYLSITSRSAQYTPLPSEVKIHVIGEDDADMINGVAADDNANTYNLMGQKVNNKMKGIVITNGKKVLVK